MFYSHFLTDDAIANLKNYKYQSSEYTTFDNLLNGFWNKAASLLPASMAPNMVTFIGFIIMLSGPVMLIITHLFYLESLVQPILVYSSLSTFTYMTFDAIDGKHARRLNRSSPMG